MEQIQTNDSQTKSGVIDAFLQALTDHKEPSMSGEEALCSMRAVFAAMKSSESGRCVEINYQ